MYSQLVFIIFVLIHRRPPGPTRTATPLPYPTLFRTANRQLRELTGSARHNPHIHELETRIQEYESKLEGMAKLQQGAQTLSELEPTIKQLRSEEHTSELQSLMRLAYAVFCLKHKTTQQESTLTRNTHKLTKTNT